MTTFHLPSGRNHFLVGDVLPGQSTTETAGKPARRQDEIILLNTRQARLEIFQYTTTPQQQTASDRFVNHLPLPEWLKKTTIICDGVPVQAAIHTDGGGIIAITQPGLKVTQWTAVNDSGDEWQAKELGSLLRGRLNNRTQPIIVEQTLYVNFQDGIQKIALNSDQPAASNLGRWLEPRTEPAAVAWALTDLDGDRQQELVEILGSGAAGVRIWRRRDGTWLPPQNAHDRAWRAAAVVPATSGDWLAAIETRQQALVRLYRWQEATDRSHHATSVLLPAQSSRPLGIILNDQPALVCIGQGDAELRVFPTGDDGSWQAPLAFPFPTGVTALARIGTAAQPTLLAWRQKPAIFSLVPGTANDSPTHSHWRYPLAFQQMPSS